MTTRTVFLSLAAVVGLTVAAPSARAAGVPAAPTFTKDVAPIMMRSCVQCHRPGQVAPMSLLTYEDARPWARSIKTRVSKREMPPWNLDPTVGIKEILDDPSLSAQEIQLGFNFKLSLLELGSHELAYPLMKQFDSRQAFHIESGEEL